MKVKKKLGVRRRVVNFLLIIAVPAVLILFWQFASTHGLVNPNALPAPSTLIKNLFKLIGKGSLQSGLKISFVRVFSGFVIGVCLGVVIGFFIGLLPAAQKLLNSLISLLRPLPLMALIPVFIIIFGIGEVTNIAVIAIGTFWPALLNTITGIQITNPKLLELARVYRIGRIRVIFEIILPSAVSSIVTGIRLSAGTAWSSVVAAEMIGASSGIGYMIMYAREVARAADLFSCVIVIGVIGLLIEKCLLKVQNACIRKFNGV